MNKNMIRLTESDLHRIVKESVNRVLVEKRLIMEYEKEDLTAPKEKRRMKKVIEVLKHPYMFKVEVEFGTFDEMFANRYRYQTFNGGQVFIGGTFNEKMNNTSRAPLIELAVEFDFDSFNRDENGKLHFNNVSSPKGIRYSQWEGTYCYYPSLFDEEMKQGLFPVKANWDGVTYIERGDYVNGKYVPRYVKTDTYRY